MILKKLILIDSNHLVHRAFWAIKNLHTRDNVPVNAVFGFFSMVLSIIISNKPDYIVFSFDFPAKTFRHQKDHSYKANRAKSPDDLKVQIPMIQKFLKDAGFYIISKKGIESDDIIATIAEQVKQDKLAEVFIVSGDMDLFQLIDDDVHILVPQNRSREMIELNSVKFKEKYFFPSTQIIDYKGLVGDSSDNLKGVNGIGSKTAVKLLKDYGNLENIYENIDKLADKLKEKLILDQAQAFHCREMAKLFIDPDLSFDITRTKIDIFKPEILYQTFNMLKFNVLLRRWQKIFPAELQVDNVMESLVNDVFTDSKKEQLSLF